ncbi:MAG: hypothetical protein HS104_09585 [Polyangiaceae bacterium]|nr:hypothetical protein [Polyangiaceae bacterium]
MRSLECPRATVHGELAQVVRLPVAERDELLALARALRAALDAGEPRRARELGLELERRLEAAGVAAESETA